VRDLAWDVRNRRTFTRFAVIGDAPWHRWITAIGAPSNGRHVHGRTAPGSPDRFIPRADALLPPGGEHEAEQWLSTRPPTATDPRLRPPD